MSKSATRFWSQQANKALVGKDARAQWKAASHRVRAKRTLYAHSYLPSVSNCMDIDGHLNIKWRDQLPVCFEVQYVADYVYDKTETDKLAMRKSGMVLEAIELANLPDTFAGMFDMPQNMAVDYLARWWGR